MPELKTTKAFIRILNKIINKNPKLYDLVKSRLESLSKDPSAYHLENHKLKGNLKDYYSITITTSIRIIFTINVEMGYFVLVDIGSHDDVY